MCPDDTAPIVHAIAKKNWSWAAKQITRHRELFGPLAENILQVIEDECKKICNPFTGFMLSKTSAEDLKTFSFGKLQEDFKRVSPFLFSIFLCITKQSANTACAAASVALKGRDDRMSAFAYYVNNVLQYAGVKKAAFKRLGKLGITTSYNAAINKQNDMAKTCGEDFHTLKVANEIFLKEEMEETSRANCESVPGSDAFEGASTPHTDGETDTPTVAVRDLDVPTHGMKQDLLSGKAALLLTL